MVAGRLLQRLANAGRVIACSALLVSCAQIHNDPINQPLHTASLRRRCELGAGVETYYDDTVVALSFSGGGTRAAAFSYGVLTGVRRDANARPLDLAPQPHRLRHRRIRRLGARRLLRAEEARRACRLQAAFPSAQCGRKPANRSQPVDHCQGLQGGINDPTLFPRWLDDNLYEQRDLQVAALSAAAVYLDQRLGHLQPHAVRVRPGAVRGALCSDLANYPISIAVAASAAVPVMFAPVVIQGYPGGCPMPLPPLGASRAQQLRTRRRCCGSLPTRCIAITPARFTT